MLIISTWIFQEWFSWDAFWGSVYGFTAYWFVCFKNIQFRIRDYCSHGRHYVMTITISQTTGNLILHIHKAVHIQNGVRGGCKCLGLPQGSNYFSHFCREKLQAFWKLGTVCMISSSSIFFHFWPLYLERPGDKNRHKIGKDVLKQYTMYLFQCKLHKVLIQLLCSCSNPGLMASVTPCLPAICMINKFVLICICTNRKFLCAYRKFGSLLNLKQLYGYKSKHFLIICLPCLCIQRTVI